MTTAPYHGRRLGDATHVSRTDPNVELMRKRKGKETRLRYGVHHVVENRNHLIVGVATAPAADVDEREAAIHLLAHLPGEHRKTVEVDKGYETQGFVAGCRSMKITPHVTMSDGRRGGSALDARKYVNPENPHADTQNCRLDVRLMYTKKRSTGGMPSCDESVKIPNDTSVSEYRCRARPIPGHSG